MRHCCVRFHEAHAVLFVVDAADPSRFAEAKEELAKVQVGGLENVLAGACRPFRAFFQKGRRR